MMTILQTFKFRQLQIILLMGMMILGVVQSRAQNSERVISGTVTDEKGAPVPGASVVVKGSAIGVPTGVNGTYSLRVADNAQTLVFSYIGYLKTEQNIAGKSTIDVQLSPDSHSTNLNEVVVVGYGTQKKATLTGSVATVKGEELLKSPQPNLSNSLAGRVPGLVASNTSGEPGADGSSLLIRGRATTGDNRPLIVIDGVANRLGGLERIDPNDVESFSVLKDAAAAIYGAQAANGVILITTKKGKTGAPTLNYSYNQGFSQPANLPKLADAPTFATLQNEIAYYRNPASGLNQVYSADDITKFGNGSDPLKYPNTNWEKEVLKDVALQDKQSLSIRGGSDAVNYYVSLGNQYQDGLYKNGASKYKQNNVLSNIGIKVNERLKLGVELAYRREDRNSPAGNSSATLFGLVYNQYPIIPAFYPNGLPSPGNAGGQNPALMVNGDVIGNAKSVTSVFNGTLTGSYQLPVKGLSLDGFLAVDQSANNSKTFQQPYLTYLYDKVANSYTTVHGGQSTPQLSQSTETIDLITTNLKVNYKRTFGPHTFSAFVAAEQSQTNDQYFNASRINYLSTNLPELSQGGSAPADQGNGGGSSRVARQNYFGRFNYDYKEKYLLEFSLRDDGSTNFGQGHRFGLFPGVSAGWRISEESWMKGSKVFTDLKLRASYGQLGNDRISPNQYFDNFGYSTGIFATGNQINATGITYYLLANPNISWEVSKKFNVAVDALLFNSLSVSVNVFKEKRSNLLAQRNASIPGVTGIGSAQIPAENFGKTDNRGFEVELNYNKQINDFRFNIGGNFTYAKNKVVYLDEAPNTLSYQKFTGLPIGSSLYYQAIGVFKSQAEIDAYPHIAGAIPGDLKYQDYNKDNKIDASDRVRSNQSNVPEIIYGITAGASYKNFDMSLLFSGQGKAVQYILPDAGTIANFPSSWADNRWSPSNTNGTYPRADDRSGTYFANQRSTFWLRNTAFLRLKNVQLGYNFSQNVASKLKVHAIRLYVSGFNLLTVTSLKDYDPEGQNETGYFYPQQKLYNIGANITF